MTPAWRTAATLAAVATAAAVVDESVDHAGGRPKRCELPMFRLRIDAAFLATVVRHYAERPEHRAAMGSQDELDRLESAYTAWRSAQQPSPLLA